MLSNLFWKKKLPDKIPKVIQLIIQELKRSENQMDCLKKTYAILTSKYHGQKLGTFLRFFNLFTTDLEKIWKKSGPLHCTTFNYLFRVLLVRSGFFNEQDLEQKITFIYYISIHQYLKVKVNSNYVNIDGWAKIYGVKFGDYSHGFHS